MTGTTQTEVIRYRAIMGGEPTVSGTHILAETILSYLRADSTADEVFKGYPSLPVDGIDAVARAKVAPRSSLRHTPSAVPASTSAG